MPGIDFITDAFLSWRDHLARLVARIVPPHDVEDIIQETYVRACQFHSRHEIKSPGAFMSKIARNLARDYVKRAEWRLTSSMDEEAVQDPADDPFDHTAAGESSLIFVRLYGSCLCSAARCSS